MTYLQKRLDFIRRAKNPFQNGNLFTVTHGCYGQTSLGGHFDLKRGDELIFQSMTRGLRGSMTLKFLWGEIPIFFKSSFGVPCLAELHLRCPKWDSQMNEACSKIWRYYYESEKMSSRVEYDSASA